jgi:hypothetical protein
VATAAASQTRAPKRVAPDGIAGPT